MGNALPPEKSKLNTNLSVEAVFAGMLISDSWYAPRTVAGDMADCEVAKSKVVAVCPFC